MTTSLVPKIGAVGTLAQLSTDASGNTVLVGADVSVPLPVKAGIPIITSIGDSIASEHPSSVVTAATYDSGTGIATLEFAAAINVRVGDIVYVTGMTDTGYDTWDAAVLSYSTAGGFFVTYSPAGTPAGASSGGNLLIPWQLGVYVGTLAWAKFLSGARFDFVSRGIGGSQIAETIARFDATVPETNPHVVLLHIGTNDIYNANATVATLIAGLTTLKQKCQKIGAQFAVCTPPPQLNTRTNWTAEKLKKQYQYAAAAKVWGLANGCPVFDVATASAGTLNYLDPSNATGNYNTGFSLDKVHPSTMGGYAIGKLLSDWLIQCLPKRDFLVSSVADTSNLINGLFTGITGSGADSGNVADDWVVSKPAGTATVAASIAARTIAADGDTCGSNQVLAITAASSGAQVQIAHASVHSLDYTGAASGIANGDELDTGLHLQVSGASDLKALYVLVNTQTATSGNRQHYYFANGVANAYPVPVDHSGVVELPALVRGPNADHGNPSSVTMSIVAIFGTTGTGAATIKLGRCTLRIKQ